MPRTGHVFLGQKKPPNTQDIAGECALPKWGLTKEIMYQGIQHKKKWGESLV